MKDILHNPFNRKANYKKMSYGFWVLGSGFWVLGSGFWVLGSADGE